MKTKTQRILEYIRDNPGAKAYDICQAAGLERRQMESTGFTKAYSYYVGWSGFRNNLCQDWGFHANPKLAKMKRDKGRYYLTKRGEESLQ